VSRYLIALVFCCLLPASAGAQTASPAFGGTYSGLEARRQALVTDWVARFMKTTGQVVETGPFYDEVLTLSAKTTFDAVTHALMTTALTREDGTPIGDALSLVERIEALRGEVAGAAGDRQFRIYVRLTPEGQAQLAASREFKRGVDNTVFHKGYPTNYRAQGGTPSIQVSIAPDGRRADVDVDYRASSFPAALFNGHLTSSNSDVRAGNNADRHSARWAGLENWWRSFFGIRLTRGPADTPASSPFAMPKSPRAGKKTIDVMVNDFLTAWLIEGDAMAAMSYVSDRSYACLSRDADDPSNFDLGLAPYQLLGNMKAAHETLGPQASLDGLVVGVRPPMAGLKIVTHPNHARVVITSVPDDVAASFDCESQLTPGDPRKTPRAYGNYFGTTFFIKGSRDQRLSLLWARENGYWKIVSWSTGGDDEAAPVPAAEAMAPVTRVADNPALSKAARAFLEAWLIRKDYDTAFSYLAPASYGCYDLERDPSKPAASSPAEAGTLIRAGLGRTGDRVGKPRNLAAVLAPADPFHPAVRVMTHRDAGTFTLTSLPNQLGDLSECSARARGGKLPEAVEAVYGEAYGMNVRFKTMGGETPVLRILWRQVDGNWKVTSYAIEAP
jgi:hypothetical protein